MRKVSTTVACVLAVATAWSGCGAAGAARSPLFDEESILELRIEAPFQELFEGAKKSPDLTVPGALFEAASGRESRAIPVTVSLRGHTSRRESECSFPKLKLEFDKSAAADTLFAGMKSIKIGTHCGEAPNDVPTPRFGRLQNERGPFREIAVYRLLHAFEVPTLRVRPARIRYVDPGPSTALVRNAMLLEDDNEAIKRLGGSHEIKPEDFTSADRVFDPADSALISFAQALIGNFDWCLMFTADDSYRCDARRKLWNVSALATDGARARPLMYDFDVSGMVAGSHRWFPDVFNAGFVASRSTREVEVIAQLQRTRTLFSRAELDATRRRFVDRKSKAYHVVEQSELDADGRRQIREYLDAFFAEVESDDRFYRPVVAVADVRPRVAPNASAPVVCGSRGAAPVGTPVSEPIETRGEMVKVAVLDALWHWGPAVKCAPIQSGAVWIEKRAISRDFPAR